MICMDTIEYAAFCYDNVEVENGLYQLPRNVRIVVDEFKIQDIEGAIAVTPKRNNFVKIS